MKKIILYATNKDGEGFVQRIGEFDSLEDINIRVSMFSKDVVLTLEEEGTNENL